MPNKAAPYQEGKPGPNCSGQGLAGYSSTQGARGWWSASTLAGAGPIISSSPSSSTLHGPKKKERTTQATRYGPETSRVPGFQEATQEGVGGRECRGSVPRGRDCRGRRGGTAPGPLSQDGHTEGQPGNWAQEAMRPGVQAPAPGQAPRGRMQAHRPWAQGAVCVETERGPETGPFKSVSPSAGPPTPNHHIQDSWAEPAGLLGPGDGGRGTEGRTPSLPKYSKPASPTSHGAALRAGLAGRAVPKKPGSRYSPVPHPS